MSSELLISDHMQVNFYAQPQILQLIVRKRLCNKSGSVVYISTSAEKHANAGRLAYAASKSAMSTMRVLGRELGQVASDLIVFYLD